MVTVRMRKQGGVVMGKLNANYGSELHLLRWMGRHRESLDRKVYKATGLKVAKWLDFGFPSGEKTYDKEIRGLSFLPADIKHKVEKSFPPHWHKSMCWDAVGIADDGTYVLVEAKAHAGELKSAKIDRASGVEIKKRLVATATSLGANGESWMGTYYQAANRLHVQHVLKDYVKAVQLNIFFCGDRRKGARCPKTKAEWMRFLNDERTTLGIDPKNDFIKAHVYDMFLNVDNES